MVYAQPCICPGKWDIQTPLGCWHTNSSPNLGQAIRYYNNQQRIENLWSLLSRLTTEQNWKKSEKKDKNLDLARELKKQWNMKVTFIPIVIGALVTVTEGLMKGVEDLEIRGRMETIQTTTLLRSARILRRVQETRRLAVTQTSGKDHQLTLMW